MWSRSPSVFWGGVLVILGVLFLLANLGALNNVNWDVVWPVLLIALGLWLVVGRIGPGGSTAAIDFAEPRDGLEKARLDLTVGAARIDLKAAPLGDQLYQLHVDHAGSPPDVKLDRATGTVRIVQRSDWFVGARRLRVDATLSDALPWDLSCTTGAIRGDFDLSTARTSAFTCKTGTSHINVNLGMPKGTVPVRVDGGALTVELSRPIGVAVQVQAAGGTVRLHADGTGHGGIGPQSWRSDGFDAAPDRYDVVVNGGAVTVEVMSR